jgi:hypothetical protein
MWFFLVTILFTKTLLLYLLSLQKKYKWDGIFLYLSCLLTTFLLVFFMYFFMSYFFLGPSVLIIIVHVLLFFSILLFFYWLFWKLNRKSILIFGIHRKKCAEYFTKLIQNLGFSNPDISKLNHTNYFEPFKVTSQDASYSFTIQFGYFSRINICATKYKIDKAKIKDFKDTCWKTFEELSESILIAPYIIGLLSMLVFASLAMFLPFTGSFSSVIINPADITYFFFLTFPELAFAIFMGLPYGIEIDEFLPKWTVPKK